MSGTPVPSKHARTRTRTRTVNGQVSTFLKLLRVADNERGTEPEIQREIENEERKRGKEKQDSVAAPRPWPAGFKQPQIPRAEGDHEPHGPRGL
jgi:hypothetical protein